MSRIGKKSVAVPAGVKIAVKDGSVNIEGPKGKLSLKLPAAVTVKVDDAAKAVNVPYTTLRQWCQKQSAQSSPTSDKARLEQLESENRQLRKQLRQAELEREILKKATAYFAKESQ